MTFVHVVVNDGVHAAEESRRLHRRLLKAPFRSKALHLPEGALVPRRVSILDARKALSVLAQALRTLLFTEHHACIRVGELCRLLRKNDVAASEFFCLAGSTADLPCLDGGELVVGSA
jgi:hypothetical protein